MKWVTSLERQILSEFAVSWPLSKLIEGFEATYGMPVTRGPNKQVGFIPSHNTLAPAQH